MNDPQKLTIAYGLSRVAYAVALLAAPKQAASPWLGPETKAGGARVGARALGVRDGALGAGAAWAATTGREVRPWLLGCIASDITDMTATWQEREALPSNSGVATLAVAGLAAAAGAALAVALDS